MDGYAAAYVAHNIPLLIVSGLDTSTQNNAKLESAGGLQIASEIRPVESEDAATLLRHFKDSDGSNLAWNSREYSGRNKFRVKPVAREYTLPARDAQLPPSIQPTSPTTKPVIHSALSPLSPGSKLYPDGLLCSEWIEKHQDLVPCAFISFYTFTSDPTISTKEDNQLKSDINSTKNTLNQSGYKTRHVVALLSEKSIVQSPDVEERLANIRKATGLDSKTSLFFLPPQSSPVELQAFVETILTTIYPVCIEYYRDLSKHSRRKRNRGVIPPPTAPPTSGTSQTLSSQGWNVRYDFKLGVFAEFRQEMDAAIRSFESGYEGLLGPDVLEAIASWSPRWNEARLLADVFAIRILRCLIWNGNGTAAVRRWQLHRDRIRDFVDRRGKGSATYGWSAWEARWATVMADMIQKVSIPDFISGGPTTFLPVEKTITLGERIQPWEYLHHPGYWFRSALKHITARRTLAFSIPEEDRSPPGSSPASQIASKAYTYDTYLCPEPHEEYPLPGHRGVDHSALITEMLAKTISEFENRRQLRLVQELQLQLGNELLKTGNFEFAIKVLRILWQKMSYRKEGWWDAVEEVGWALRKAAVQSGDGGAIMAVDWELMHKDFMHHPNWHYDLSKSLQGLEPSGIKPAVVLHEKDIHSFLSATYAFEYPETKVGEPCLSQLTITSSAIASAVPITMTDVRVSSVGSLKPIQIKHLANTDARLGNSAAISFSTIVLTETIQDDQPILSGEADLTFRPGQVRVFEFSSIFREAGDAKATSATFSMATRSFDLEYVHTFGQTVVPDIWWGDGYVKKRLVRESAFEITVLPKPPKIELRIVDPHQQYYTNEQITLRLEVLNGEDVDSIVNLDSELLGENAPAITMQIDGAESKSISQRNENSELAGLPIGRIPSAALSVVEILIPPLDSPAIYGLSIKAAYHLVSDMETAVYRSLSMQLEVINPFEANYDFSPRIHHDSWPSLFNHDEGDENVESGQIQARGLSQKWCLTARFASFATDDLIVEDVDVNLLAMNGGIQCYTKKLTPIPEGFRVVPNSIEEALFDTFTQKLSLDDRGTATLDVALAIKWRRDRALGADAPLNTTVLAVPRLLISSSEPRVLAAVSYSSKISSMIHFDVTIENPSNHFLTFGLTMEPSEKFAFSGTKQSTLQLVPLSRRTVKFRLLPSLKGDWIGPIHCVIRDRYFQKVLKISPTEGMKVEKEGILVWVPPEDDI